MPSDLLDILSRPPVKISGRSSAKASRATAPKVEEVFPQHSGRDYAKKYIRDEEKLYERESFAKTGPIDEEQKHGAMSEVETVTVTNAASDIDHDDKERKLGVYDEFSFDRNKSKCKPLPINEYKTKILNTIEAYKVVIIKGATGCGKTTQIPQFILDEAKEKRQFCNIVVTQPRRLAAISVAKRVCKERGWELGSVVGYQVGQNRKVTENTCITYCTTGVLLQKLVSEKSLMGYTHIILDEIHERDADMDFLLIIVRKFLNTVSRHVKVILMSATINTDRFADYFYAMHDGRKFAPPVLETMRDTNYIVKTYHLNDFSTIPESRLMITDGPDITKKGYITAVRIIQALDSLEKKEAEKNAGKFVIGAVLVFLPGLLEIEEMKRTLDAMKKLGDQTFEWWVVPLHSSITTEEQDLVFANPPEKHRKVILSTNIAESSITVPDIVYVIDFCLTKVLVTDSKTNLTSLQLCWASKNSLKQRAGRVGRVADGRVYRLIEKSFYEDLDEEAVPEMLRCPLSQLVLQAKLLDQGPPIAIFSLALSQPDLRNIEQTVLTLKEIGALLIAVQESPSESGRGRRQEGKINYKIDDFDGELTFLGRTIAKLPMDVRLGKLIFFGNIFNILDECVVMACAMSVKNMFSSPFQEYLKAYNSKLSWANSSCSDCIAFLNAYMLWRKKKSEGSFRIKSNEAQWAKDRFLQLKTLEEIYTLHQDIIHRLRSTGLLEENKNKKKLTPIQKNLFLKLAIAAAFYPNYFLRGFHGGQIDEKEAVATLSGHDPYTTVYLQGMPTNQPGILYKRTIERQFEEVSSRANIIFDSGSKVLINFGHSINPDIEGYSMEIPGKIEMAVYRAVKMRQLKPEIRIPVLNPDKADKRLNNYLAECKQRAVPSSSYTTHLLPWPWNKNLDNPEVEIVELLICHVQSPNCFWAISDGKMFQDLGYQIFEELSRPENREPIVGRVKIGGIYILQDSSSFFRCRVISYKRDSRTFDVILNDIGGMKTGVTQDRLFNFSQTILQKHEFDKLPDLATEFSLAKVKPPAQHEDKWSSKATAFLKKFAGTKNRGQRKLTAKIYSVVENVVKVKLYCYENGASHNPPLNINKELIKLELAEKAEEPFLSKKDHMERANMRKLIGEGNAMYPQPKNMTEKEKLFEQLSSLDIGEPVREECTQEAVLKGPYSPLEMKIFSATQCSVSKLAQIERNSVNSVLLDTNPLDEYERMVVAAFVSISPSGSRLSLRDTSIMPSIPGLPALICLLFSPMVELRCDPEFTRLTGAVCGLGYRKENSRAFNPDNDMEIVFDIDIQLDHIVKINKIRYWLNIVLSFDDQSSIEKTTMESCREKLIEYITDLIWQPWTPQELHYHTEAYKWNLLPYEKYMNPCIDEEGRKNFKEPADDLNSVYRLIWGIELDGDPSTRLNQVTKNLTILEDFADGRVQVKNFECILCQSAIPNPMNAKLHLKSGLHKARAEKYIKMTMLAQDSDED